MKLQGAIDRVSIEDARHFVDLLDGKADVIEIGTSLIKDYGLENLRELIRGRKSVILGDLKTCDEGAYEFRRGFEAGFGILTVMGPADDATLDVCAETAEQCGGTMMIDLLGCSKESISHIARYKDAVYCMHSPVDSERGIDLAGLIAEFKAEHPDYKTAAAGGISSDTIPKLKEAGLDLAVIGSGIIKALDPAEKLDAFIKELS